MAIQEPGLAVIFAWYHRTLPDVNISDGGATIVKPGRKVQAELLSKTVGALEIELFIRALGRLVGFPEALKGRRLFPLQIFLVTLLIVLQM